MVNNVSEPDVALLTDDKSTTHNEEREVGARESIYMDVASVKNEPRKWSDWLTWGAIQ